VEVAEKVWKGGLPPIHRATFWRILVGYYTQWPHLNFVVAQSKQIFYNGYVKQHNCDNPDPDLIQMIRQDLESVSHYIPFFRSNSIQELLQRVIYVLYHECMMDYYTFGMAQLVLVPLYVLLMEYQDNLYAFDVTQFDEASMAHMEQDLFWITYSYFKQTDKEMFENPVKFADSVENNLKSYDEQLHTHLISKNVQFLTLIDGWLSKMCFPIFRKFPLLALLWDKYIAAGEEFWQYHACVCTALLVLYKRDMLSLKSSQSIHEFFTRLTTITWGYEDMKNFIDIIQSITEKQNLWNKISDYWVKSSRIKKSESKFPDDHHDSQDIPSLNDI